MAAGLLGLQGLVLVGIVVFYLVELARGAGQSTTRVLGSSAVILVFAAGLAALAVQVWRGASRARTGAGVWQVLLVLVGVSLLQADEPWPGFALLLLAVTTLAGLVLDRRRD
ncbi:MAG TPA: hypothetical protein VFJ97_06185 [Dermatophilaceae bacterium]|nr:hypothetical protein [Dermatophilaceae bacterium]